MTRPTLSPSPCELLLSCALALLACQPATDAGNGQQALPSPHEQLKVITEHRPTPALGAADKKLGDDCTAHGASECQSQLCLHVGGRGAGYVCSQGCADTTQCPAHWQCKSVSVSTRRAVCVPPSPERKS
jgi:hypothetical protein